PRPWRGRKTSRVPPRRPITNSSEGSPKGVSSRTRSTAERPGSSYSPLPPMTPRVGSAMYAPRPQAPDGGRHMVGKNAAGANHGQADPPEADRRRRRDRSDGP